MADELDTKQSEEMNDENDAREEDIVEDTDSDTRDIEDSTNNDYEEMRRMLSDVIATQDKILAQMASIREAQGILVENGAVINDVEDIDTVEEDSFKVPETMNLLI